MRKTLRGALIGLSAVSLLGAMALPGFTVGASDGTPDTIEPILVKADAQVSMPAFRTTALGEANIVSFDLSPGTVTAGPASGQAGLIGTITTKDPIMRCTGGLCNIQNTPPYGGASLMLMFQTPEQGLLTNVGCADAACTGQSGWGVTHPDNSSYFFLYYSASQTETKEDWGLGSYDPAGRIVGLPLEPGVGQLFGVFAQAKDSICTDGGPNPITNPAGFLPSGLGHNIGISFTGTKTVQLHLPYDFKWRTNGTSANPCAARTKRIAKSGNPLPATTGFPVIGLNSAGLAANTLRNAVAFSWALHEIGGPDPIGLILGYTWYMDSVPALQSKEGYRVGTPAGDPNPATFAGPTCILQTRGVAAAPPPFNAPGNRNPLYNGAPCMRANPVGPGFAGSGLSQAL